jgi:hypothetical protein
MHKKSKEDKSKGNIKTNPSLGKGSSLVTTHGITILKSPSIHTLHSKPYLLVSPNPLHIYFILMALWYPWGIIFYQIQKGNCEEGIKETKDRRNP